MTGVSRRSLMAGSAAGLAATTVALEASAAVATGPSFTSSDALYARSRFAPLRGKGFSLVRNGKGTPVVLREVADIDGAPARADNAFRLTFSCRGAAPEQATYSLRRSGFAPTSLFVVPDAARGGVTAIINATR
jgi:hypothetical protein